MDPQKQREIASKGGKAAHQKGTAHEFTSDEARVAGRKGGAASRERRGKMNTGGGNGGGGTENQPSAAQQQSVAQTGESAEGQSMGESAENMRDENAEEEIETQE